MKKLVVGILAHVDAGKTTLSEGLLYVSGCLKTLGRVDHQNAFLDTDALEREKGITIFSKQAVLPLQEVEITLLDTPGHVDFSAEMERTLRVLDYAILVISGTDGVQGHTRTLWRLLKQYDVPTFLFINKMDLVGAERASVLEELKKGLADGCVDFGTSGEPFYEAVAMCEETALNAYLETGAVADGEIRSMIAKRRLFPCYFGSALRLEGIDQLLAGLEHYADRPEYPSEFGARVFKIARDAQGSRLTYLKVTGGNLKVKDLLSGGVGEGRWEEKADQLRIYSGAKYRTVDQASVGTVCAVTGLSHTFAGEGLGWESGTDAPVLEPVLTYQVELSEGCDPHSALLKLRELEEEDPLLHLVWNEALHEIHIQLMGEVQLEILKRRIAQRFGLEVTFGRGNIVYRETIAAPVEGVGHYEPLRHYAEVHLLLEPGERGSGVHLVTACSEDELDRSWQHLILTHLAEREHPGVLTGSPLTDVKITLAAGRAHLKHTEGGDFRQATYRAVRQGLKCAQNVLLEPWYEVRLEVPVECVGRAMSDLQQRCGTCQPPEHQGEMSILIGAAPVATMRDYWMEVTSYTKGRGRLLCTPNGYYPCHNTDEVVAQLGYDSERDLANPTGSIFCARGAGFFVPWDQVRCHMHMESGLQLGEKIVAEAPEDDVRSNRSYSGTWEEDRELQAIFERTYGKVERTAFEPQRKPARTSLDEGRYNVRTQNKGPEYLLVDGYNIIYAWDELKAVAKTNLDAARQMLLDLLANYQGFRKCVVIVVFDAYKVKGNLGSATRYHNIHVVYTKEAETADSYIEKATYEIAQEHRVRVATSDGAEQLIILGHGALRVSARIFKQEVEQAQGQIASFLNEYNRKNRGSKLGERLNTPQTRG